MEQEITQQHPDYVFVMQQLEKRKGRWRQIADDSGLNYWWLTKVGRGVTTNPGINTISQAAQYFRLLERQESERAQVLKRAAG